jgi:MSHA biogenesis protein MshM
MYLQHFGLREFPFSITPDTEYFLPTNESQQALNTLLLAIVAGEGFIKITGEVGTGKTLLCKKLIKALGSRFTVAYIFNPYRQPMSLFLELCTELEVPIDREKTPNEYEILDALIQRVIDLNAQGRRVIICLDEAQAMPIETLEALRLITNLETEKRKLLQVIIFGQPELNKKLDHPSIRQLKQRITFQYHLTPMNPDQLGKYLKHRMIVAGHPDGQVFNTAAVRTLSRYSGCTPRLVNILANKSLLSAYADRRVAVLKKDVDLAAADTESIHNKKPWWRGWLFSALLAAACITTITIGKYGL